MKWLLCFIIAVLSLRQASAQGSINLLCLDVKKNGNLFYEGDIYRKSFESVLSNLDNPPTLVEREKLDEILEKMTEERNLAKDFDMPLPYFNKLKAANIDYLAYGNFTHLPLTDIIEFDCEFIKISGDDVSSKMVFSTLRFDARKLSREIFEEKLTILFSNYSFINGLGVVDNDQLQIIKNRLIEKDKEINYLMTQVNNYKKKEDSINTLMNTVPDVTFDLLIRETKLFIEISFHNDVPILFRPYLRSVWDKDQKIYSQGGWVIHHYPIEVYPNKANGTFLFEYADLSDKDLPTDRHLGFNMLITYSSIFYPEIQKPELGDKKVVLMEGYDPSSKSFYKINPDGN